MSDRPSAVADRMRNLLTAAADGDRNAWRTIVQEYRGLLWSVARAHRLSEPDAADVVQVTWMRLFEHLGSIEHPERLHAWLATTCRYECLAVIRRRQRVVVTDDDELERSLPPDASSVDTGVITDETNRAIWVAFAKLDERCQRILRVLVAEVQTGRPSYKLAAEALGMKVGSLGPIRGRCLDRLRGFLAEGGISG